MMLRSLNLFLGISASPFRRWSPRDSMLSSKIVPLFDSSITSPQSGQFSVSLLPQCIVHVKALKVSSGGSDSSAAGDAVAAPAVSSPMANSISLKSGDSSINLWILAFISLSAFPSRIRESNVFFDVQAHKPKDKFCQFCGGLTKQVIPDGDEKMRTVCTVCRAIHYENPKMVVGCLVEHDGKVLLCKRNIHPSYGLWTLPAGYLEIGESAAEGAMRETLEEANAEVEIISPFAQLDIPHIGQSYIIFRARMKKPYFSPGPESLECMLFTLDDIPFGSLAFSSIYVTLKMYSEDIKNEKLRFHYCIINKRPGASLSDPNGFDMEHHLHS